MVPAAITTWMYVAGISWRHLVVPNPSATVLNACWQGPRGALECELKPSGSARTGSTPGYSKFCSLRLPHWFCFIPLRSSGPIWNWLGRESGEIPRQGLLGEVKAYEGTHHVFGLDGVEVAYCVLVPLLGILPAFPVAFAISGNTVISFAIIAALDSVGYLIRQAIDKSSAEYSALADEVRATLYPCSDIPTYPWGGCVYRRLGNGD
jgi:hypothetical protein